VDEVDEVEEVEEVEEMEEVEEEIMEEKKDSDSDENYEDELPDLCPVKKPPLYAVGSYVAAVYDGQWFVAQVEAEEPENECEGFTLLKYMQRIGRNQFVWGTVPDILKTINKDILLKTGPPIPVSSRYLGYPKDIVKTLDEMLRVKWFIIITRFYILSFWGTFLHSWDIHFRDMFCKDRYHTVKQFHLQLLKQY
jgi:hypothetical protein